MSTRVITYLDANAGAPLSANAQSALLSLLKDNQQLIPNPSSIHSQGRRAKRALAEAREQIARSLGPKVDFEQLVFTSSGTEANQLVVRSVLEAKLNQGHKPHWILTPVEHDSNRQMIRWLESKGGSVSFLPVNGDGVPQPEAIIELFRPETSLVSSVWVNNETGVITDVVRLANLTRQQNIPLHLDGAQAWGKIPFDLSQIEAQFVTFSGHKIGGLAGAGLVWLARGNPLAPVIFGKQEKGRRGGTENLLGIVAMGAAAAELQPASWVDQVSSLRDRLEDAITTQIPGTCINGKGAPRVANTLNLSFDGIVGDGLVMALDLEGYCVSSGSACSSGVLEPSHVLLAMGKSKLEAMAAVRVSLSKEVSWESLEGFVNVLSRAVSRMRNKSHESWAR